MNHEHFCECPENLNEFHGSSIASTVKYDDATIRRWLTWVDQTDPNFQIVYVSREKFNDGLVVYNVIYWMSDPTPQPPAPRNQPVKKLPPLVRQARFDDIGQEIT